MSLPPGLKRPFKKNQSAQIKEGKRAPDDAAERRASSRAPEDPGPARHALVFPIVGSLVLILISYLVLSSSPKGNPMHAAPSTPDLRELATSAFETALATRASALRSPAPSELPATPDGGTSAAAAPGASQPVNPWVNEVPESACIQTDLPQTGRAVEVVDGRTIKVLLDGDGRVFSVRYIGLGSPQGSTSQLLLSNSAAMNAQLTFHKQVTLVRDISDTDPSGSLLRYVMVDRVFINYALIAAGYAPAESAAPDTACAAAFDSAQRRAQARGLGLWLPPTP